MERFSCALCQLRLESSEYLREHLTFCVEVSHLACQFNLRLCPPLDSSGCYPGRRAPNANVIVMGYYRILSEESFAQGVKLIQSLFAVFGVLPGPIELSSKDNLVRNSSEFFLRSQENLKRAVADSNATLSGPDRIGFADPGFREENALFATDPWTCFRVILYAIVGFSRAGSRPNRTRVST